MTPKLPRKPEEQTHHQRSEQAATER